MLIYCAAVSSHNFFFLHLTLLKINLSLVQMLSKQTNEQSIKKNNVEFK